ncbi:hypothetical protein DdX_20549 [Ditylenchus destructor]|uniref:Uncharacterized protein n=1 Tax=Ditylenchus destructor TaxID=166010 RepID=A0AAD4MG36_9BILA|nr:hypothetical protein DdX_20549 [Ditylenchus destructor]
MFTANKYKTSTSLRCRLFSLLIQLLPLIGLLEILQFARFVVKIASVMAPLAISILECKRKGKKEKATKKTKAPSECHVKTTSVAVREYKKCKSVQQPNTSKLAKNTGSIIKVQRQEPRKEDSVKVSDNEQAENLTECTPDGNSIQASRKSAEMAANDENVKEVEEYDSFKKSIECNYINEGHKDLLKNESLNEVDRGQQREIISVEAKELCVATTENTPKKNDVENKSSVTCSFKVCSTQVF